MTKNLLFDLGGVIMNIDRMQAVKAFERLGMTDADSFFDPYQQRGLFGRLEEGKVSADDFYRQITPMFNMPVTVEQIKHGLFEFLRGIPSERLARLEALRRAGHGVYLLSNTNSIMWNGYILPEFKKAGKDFHAYFDGDVESFKVGMCKPDLRIFQYTIRTLGLNPSDTTFFDDGAANVEAARVCGLHAEHVTPDNDFMTLTQL